MSIFTTKQKIASISLLVTSMIFSTVGQTADLYQVIDLGALVDNSVSSRSVEAFAINDQGFVVGNSSGGDFRNHAFIYRDEQMLDLGFLPFEGIVSPFINVFTGNSFAFGINNNNIVAGYSVETLLNDNDLETDTEIAVYYDGDNLNINRIPQFLPATPQKARAISINNNNLIVGFGLFDPEDGDDVNGDPLTFLYRRGFFYDVNTDLLTIVNPLGGENAQRSISLRAVNDAGVTVGVSELVVNNIPTNEVVVINSSTPEIVEKIDIFGGLAQVPWAINESGKIVGRARISSTSSITEAFLYDTGSDTAIGLGFLNDSFADSEAFDINESDQVVGISQVQNSPDVYHAFLYENDSLKDINKLISCEDASAWQLSEARSINDSGVITGTGIFEGEKRAFMLMPLAGSAPNCEEESSGDSGSIPVIGLLLLTMLAWGRRKNK